MKADVAIVIVTYNSEGHIAPCLESVFSQRKSVSQQVIVVDNSPNDRTVNFIRENFPQVELVVPGANLGFAKGVNLGVKHSDADFVLLLNPDTILLENAVDVIVEFARKNPGHGLYGGRTQTPTRQRISTTRSGVFGETGKDGSIGRHRSRAGRNG